MLGKYHVLVVSCGHGAVYTPRARESTAIRGLSATIAVFGQFRYLNAARRPTVSGQPRDERGTGQGTNKRQNVVCSGYRPLEHANQLKRRKKLYLALHPETKKGTAQAKGMNKKLGHNVTADSATTFVADTAKKTGKSGRAIHEEVQIAENLVGDVKDAITELPKQLGKPSRATRLSHQRTRAASSPLPGAYVQVPATAPGEGLPSQPC